MKKLLMATMVVVMGAAMLVIGGMSVADQGFVGSDTCKSCHEDRALSYDLSIHGKKGVPGNPANRGGCESCHGGGSSHVEKGGGKGTDMFPFGKKLDAGDRTAKCLACHEESRHLAFWDNGKHKSAGIACDDCHSVHSGGEKNLKTAQPDLCFGCHKDKRMMARRQSHHPILEGLVKCTDCHNPHGGFGQRMIKADSVNDLCFTCHAEKRGPFRLEHPPVVENCLNCHEVHGSNHRSMLVSKPPQLCQQCHGEGGGHPFRVYTNLRGFKGSDLRTQAVSRSCMNCHTNIHGSSVDYFFTK